MVNGVRNSWLATRMNASFKALACRSSALACSSSWFLRCRSSSRPLAFLQQVVLFAGLVQDGQQLVGIPRLADVAIDVALVDGVDDGLDVGVAGEQQTDGVGPIAADAAKELDAADVRHALVGHDDVDWLLVQQAQTIPSAGGAEHAVLAAQQVLQALHHVGFIIDDQKRVTPDHDSKLRRGLTVAATAGTLNSIIPRRRLGC